jgi:N-acetylmuramate 1-kinase
MQAEINVDKRQTAMLDWLNNDLDIKVASLRPLAGDASFRRYFRVELVNGTRSVIMDAPPALENVDPFIKIAKAFTKQGIQVPQILARERNQGFLLLTDFGDRLYLSELNQQTADSLYQRAIGALLSIQACCSIEDYILPIFDRALMGQELAYFQEWFLHRHLNYTPTSTEEQLINDTFQRLIDDIECQPKVCVHRDYHSRNLLILDDGGVGIIDFQDAVIGPISYDLVSLLKDCYIAWPAPRVKAWLQFYYGLAISQKLMPEIGIERFTEWFHCAGLQRHLKVLGIFARLHHRDGKSAYLKDLPQVFTYIQEGLRHFPQFDEFQQFLTCRIQPMFTEVSHS